MQYMSHVYYGFINTHDSDISVLSLHVNQFKSYLKYEN